ncbi:MAG: anaerobic ribonucleoside-triphosphate reductase [Candidatus Woesearchaeota archaeon]
MTETCCVCNKELDKKEGIISSTGVLVCSDDCKEKFMSALPNHGESQLTVYSRVTGYYTPVSSWNKGKRQEFLDRRTYSLKGVV